MIDRNKYEKISDDVMIIANKVVLRMNVALSYYYNDNNRINYHREVEYYSQKACMNLVNIKRTYDYYLSIENTITKDYIRIGILEITKLQHALNEAYRFFSDPKYADVYAKKDGDLIIYRQPEPIIITGLSMDKYLMFEPCVYLNFRGETEQGLRMYLSSRSSYCDISLNRLEAFIYTINNFNLFESAQLMINYFQRPEYGSNLYSCNVEPEVAVEGNFQGKDGRTIKPNNNLSYFDKMKGLEE